MAVILSLFHSIDTYINVYFREISCVECRETQSRYVTLTNFIRNNFPLSACFAILFFFTLCLFN